MEEQLTIEDIIRTYSKEEYLEMCARLWDEYDCEKMEEGVNGDEHYVSIDIDPESQDGGFREIYNHNKPIGEENDKDVMFDI